MNPSDIRIELDARRGVLVEQFRRLKEAACVLIRRGSVEYDREHCRYFIRSRGYFRGTYKDMMAARKLIILQAMIHEQAVRLLELENTLK